MATISNPLTEAKAASSIERPQRSNTRSVATCTANSLARKESSEEPAPAPTACSKGTSAKSLARQLAEVVLPIPISPAMATLAPRKNDILASSVPIDMASRNSCNVIAGSFSKFRVPAATRRDESFE